MFAVCMRERTTFQHPLSFCASTLDEALRLLTGLSAFGRGKSLPWTCWTQSTTPETRSTPFSTLARSKPAHWTSRPVSCSKTVPSEEGESW